MFRFVSQITELYKHCPMPLVANSMLGLAFK